MTLVVEDGSVVTGADAYVSVSFVDTYNDSYKNDSTWSASSTAAKERAIRSATAWLDARYNKVWSGYVGVASQPLSWPRYMATDANGWTIDSNSIPLKLQQACAEAAIRAVSDSLLADVATPGSVTLVRKKIGPLETETRYSGASQSVSYPYIDQLLTGLICSSPGSAFGVMERS